MILPSILPLLALESYTFYYDHSSLYGTYLVLIPHNFILVPNIFPIYLLVVTLTV